MTTTWSPTDKEANMVLSNTNHTATLSVDVNSAVRGTSSHSSGKWYFEMTSIASGSARAYYGVANSSFTLSSGSVGGAWALSGPGTTNFIDNGSVPNLSPGFPVVDGHVLCVAVDLDNDKIWMRYDGGNWNNNGTANPSTNTGGENMDGVSGAAIFPLISFQGIGTCHATLNAGDTTFTQTLPSNFLPWDGPLPPPPPVTRTYSTVIH